MPMTNAKMNEPATHGFEVASIEKTATPDGSDGSWYRYVLENGRSTVTGYRRGTRKQVAEYANRTAEELNERRGSNGRSVWAPRRSK